MATAYAIECTHEEVNGLVIDTALQFSKAYGGETDELVAEARLLFMKCYWRYVNHYRKTGSNDGTFTHYIRMKIWYGLLDNARRIARRRKRLTPGVDLSALSARQGSSFTPEAFVANLSDDAAYVARLALDPPTPVRQRAASKRGEQAPSSIRAAVVEFLKDVGWGAGRIRTTFREIREALTP
jgi:hypothetical protein